MNEVIVFREAQSSRPLFRAKHAYSFWSRLRGLIGRPALAPEEALLLTPCGGVHTFGMRNAIDVVFLNAGKTIVKCVPELRPGRTATARGARHVLELAPGALQRTGLRAGDSLEWTEARE